MSVSASFASASASTSVSAQSAQSAGSGVEFREHVLNVPYLEQPQVFYAQKVKNTNSLLLESAEMINKRGTQSLIGVNCAVKIVGMGKQVQLFALNANGHSLIKHLMHSSFFSSYSALAANVKVEGAAVGALVKESFDPALVHEPVLTFTFGSVPEFCDEISRLKQPNPLDILRLIQREVQSLSKILFTGVIAFDFINTFEQVVDPQILAQGDHSVPDLSFYLYDVSMVIDHVQRTTSVCTYSFTNETEVLSNLEQQAQQIKSAIEAVVVQEAETKGVKVVGASLSKAQMLREVEVDISDQDFGHMISQLKQHICAGDIFQVVPSRTFNLPCLDVDRSFAILKQSNPSPYMFCLKDPEFTLFGASPEFALRFDAVSREVSISPIAGTRPRGRQILPDGSLGEIDPSLDERIELELRLDHKEVAEHIMLVDLARNDLARIAATGTRHTVNLLHVDKYQSVMHLVSDVKATLRDDLDGLHAYLSSMNMGTLSGAPKIKAHQLIYQYEGKRRGAYGGVVARLSADGSFDSCIAIRSALVKDGKAYVQAGCGVVYDSVEQAECDETRNKAASVLMAIAQANQQVESESLVGAKKDLAAQAAQKAQKTPKSQAMQLTKRPHVIFIDNFDSFSYNLVDAIKVIGCQVEVYRNDVSIVRLQEHIAKLQESGQQVLLVLSPGPAHPDQSGGLMEIISTMAGKVPMLGICLGHQALGLYLGGKVVRAPEIIHGKASALVHQGHCCFAGLPSPLEVARYHSLVVEDLPDTVQVLADFQGMCMSLFELKLKMLGLQFHPESVITTYGQRILEQALHSLVD